MQKETWDATKHAVHFLRKFEITEEARLASWELGQMDMNQYSDPFWWGSDNDFVWDHLKVVLRHDWNRRTNDLWNSERGFWRNQCAGAKPTGSEEPVPPRGNPTFEELEPAYRFGCGACLEYGIDHPDWDDDLKNRLAREWQALHPTRKEKWEQDLDAIRWGWSFATEDATDCCTY